MNYITLNSFGQSSEYLTSRAVETCLCVEGRKIESWYDIDRLTISEGGEYRLEWAGNVETGTVFKSEWAVFGKVITGGYAVLREISLHNHQYSALAELARLRKEWAGENWRTATHVAEVWKTA